MASPPAVRVPSVPASRSIRIVPSSCFATALTRSSFAPVTVLSTETTTWLVAGSVHQAVPGMRADLSSAEVARARSSAPRVTSLGVAPAARTFWAAASSVTVTTMAPAASAYVPAERSPSAAASAVAFSGVADVSGAACAGAPASEPTISAPATVRAVAVRRDDPESRIWIPPGAEHGRPFGSPGQPFGR